MAIDPVCGMQVDEATAKIKSEYKGKTYYFCAPGCKTTFDADPEKYAAQAKKPMSAGMPAMKEEKKKPWWKFW